MEAKATNRDSAKIGGLTQTEEDVQGTDRVQMKKGENVRDLVIFRENAQERDHIHQGSL